MCGTRDHIDYPEFVFHLAHHDAQLTGMTGHPVKNSACRTHGIGTVKFHAGGRTAHSQGLIALVEGELLTCIRQGKGKRLEMSSCIIVTCPRHTDVFIHHSLPLPFELKRQNLFEDAELNTDELEDGGEGNGVLNQVALNGGSQLFDREGTKLSPFVGRIRFDLVAVIEDRRTGLHEPEMSIHGVLV